MRHGRFAESQHSGVSHVKPHDHFTGNGAGINMVVPVLPVHYVSILNSVGKPNARCNSVKVVKIRVPRCSRYCAQANASAESSM